LIAIHFFIHGGIRPLWLGDVAALLETTPNNIAWDIASEKIRAPLDGWRVSSSWLINY
jgi:hypothetical protein